MQQLATFYLLAVDLNLVFCGLIGLNVLKCNGMLRQSNGVELPAVYLSRPQFTLQEDSSSKITLHDVVPLLLKDAQGTLNSNVLGTRGQVIGQDNLVNTDDGVFDNLPYDWLRDKSTKQRMYSTMSTTGTFVYSKFAESMAKILHLDVKKLFLEVQDKRGDNLILGAALMVSEAVTNRQQVVECHTDEVVGFSLALDLPVWIDKLLYEAVSISAELRNAPELCIYGSYAPDKRTIANTSRKKYPAAWEILNPQIYCTLSISDKREILRTSGVQKLPRPRLGAAAVDSLLLGMLDNAVRSEVMRLRATNGNAGEHVKLLDTPNDYASVKSESTNHIDASTALEGTPEQFRAALLRRIETALHRGDLEQAERLQEQFVQLTGLRADPTQPGGSYDPYLDQDDWYMQARRKAMGK